MIFYVLVGFFLISGLIGSSSQQEPVYKEIGESHLFSSNSAVRPITSILWMLNVDKVVDWDKGDDIKIYASFEDRVDLEKTTGNFTLNKLTVEDSGVYSVVINKDLLPQKYKLTVIARVPKPSISYSCLKSDDVECKLTCEGNATAQSTFTWSKDGQKMAKDGPSLTLSKALDWDKEITCTLANPVSEESSNAFRWSSLFPPARVPKPSISYSCLKSDDVECKLTCEGNATAQSTFTWSKDGQNMAKDGPSLTLSKALDWDKEITCTLANPVSEESSDAFRWSSLFPPARVRKPRISHSCLKSDDVECKLTCEGNATAQSTFTWSKDGQKMAKDGPSLTLSKALDWDKKITCTLANPVSEESSDAFRWSSLFPPDPDSVGMIVGIIISVLIVFVVLLILLPVCLYYSSKRVRDWAKKNKHLTFLTGAMTRIDTYRERRTKASDGGKTTTTDENLLSDKNSTSPAGPADA